MSYVPLASPSVSNNSDDTMEKPSNSQEFQNIHDIYDGLPPVQRRKRTMPLLITGFSLLVLVVMFAGFTTYKHMNTANLANNQDCGMNSSEALARGCHFDVMSFAWVPSRCFDEVLMDQFLALRDWQWYFDPTSSKTADPTKVAVGAYDQLYVTQEYHMYHCTYMWRKMHRAVLADRVIDGYIGDIHHTAHCEMQILTSGRNMSDISTTIYTKYVNCPRRRESAGRWGWYRVINGKKVHRNP